MKNSLFTSLFVSVCALLHPGYGQNTWVVSNDPGFYAADFDNVQEAIDSASSGDKIYVHGSPFPYDDISVSKKLHLIGSGFWKDENNIMDENIYDTQMGYINLYAGSDSSIVEGFRALAIQLINCDNIVIRYNQFCCDVNQNGRVIFWELPINTMIYGNAMGRAPLNSAISANIFNNIIGLFNDCVWENSDSNVDCVVQNNAFINTSAGTISNCVFRNNIVQSPNFSLTNCVVENNIFVDDDVSINGIPTDSLGNGNIDSVDINTIWNLSDPSPDGKYRLIGDENTNVAFGAGINGEDCGPFGGDSPYRLSGIVKVPTIYQMLIPLLGDTTNMLNIKIRAKSN